MWIERDKEQGLTWFELGGKHYYMQGLDIGSDDFDSPYYAKIFGVMIETCV